jgi:large subunit ribosomal protein L14
MIQKGSKLTVIDNSGARFVSCIHVSGGYRRRYALIGDTIVVSVKKLRNKRKLFAKVKKGDVIKALIIRTKTCLKSYSAEYLNFKENSVILFNKQNKLIGTRLFGIIPSHFRYTKHLKIVSLASGLAY